MVQIAKALSTKNLPILFNALAMMNYDKDQDEALENIIKIGGVLKEKGMMIKVFSEVFQLLTQLIVTAKSYEAYSLLS